MMRRNERVRPALATAGKVVEKLRNEGPKQLARRAVRRAYQRWDVSELNFSLLPGDVADSAALDLTSPPPRPDAGPIRVGWLCTPPAAGSGGHTTMFRMVKALEDAGHSCELVFYDRHHGNTAAQAEVVRMAWPWVHAPVRSIDDGLDGLDVVVATAWDTAHVLATRSEAVVHRAIFIQDFEPMFYPHGSDHALAMDSYRFGFTNIALGGMVTHWLTQMGVPSVQVTFGRDTEVYSYDNTGPRWASPSMPSPRCRAVPIASACWRWRSSTAGTPIRRSTSTARPSTTRASR